MKHNSISFLGSLFICLLAAQPATKAYAQNNIGGHFGAVLPLFSMTDGETSSIADNVVAGFPMGITVKIHYNVAFDLEVVPFLDENAVSNIIFHPGVLMGLSQGFTFGLRGAFETAGSYGVTPLINKSIPFPGDPDTVFFIEAVLPIRFYQAAPEYPGAPVNVDKTIAMALHVGVGF